MHRFLLLFWVLVSAPVFAQDGPAFDCAKAESSAEKLVCTDAALAVLDRRLADRFAAAVTAAKSLGSGAAAAEAELRAIQRGWVKGRDDCWKAPDLRSCVEDTYLTREGELVAKWMLQKPSATVFWACDGNPANEVVTYFFETELPSIRIERGDKVTTGSIARSASGVRYEAWFGQSIWIKGNEATYREPDPDGRSYTCVIAREE